MASLNECKFIGHAGKDPELRYTAEGTAIANLSIACTEKRKDVEHTEWVRCVFFNKLAEIVGEYIKKGSQIYVSGRMQTRKWQDKDGADRYSTEIVCYKMLMLGKRDAQTHEAQNVLNQFPGSREVPDSVSIPF